MTSVTMINTKDKFPGQTACFLVATAAPSISLSHASLSTAMSRIAPKQPQQTQLSTSGSDSVNKNADLLRAKKRIQLGQLNTCHSNLQQSAAVARRNERERNRVRLVNLGFATLRQHVPHATKNKKMSKVDTLRSAVEYIKQLQMLLNDQGSSSSSGESQTSTRSDENAVPQAPYSSPTVYSSISGSVTSPAGSGASSPTPSLCSDPSSPLDLLNADDDDLIDFSWF